MDKKDINEYADKTYEQVSGWINNCDSKASIMIALIGVFLSIVFTSDYLLKGITEELKVIIGLFSGNSSCRTWGSLILIILLGLSAFYFIKALETNIHEWFSFELSNPVRNKFFSFFII